jgi:REP element-mobilizing transposase RayT
VPRPLRIDEEGAIAHVTARGNNRARILDGDSEKELLLGLVERAVSRFDWICHAYCVMNTHYHLLLQTPLANLSVGMHWLNLTFARRYNRRTGRTGHVFESRFWSEPVDSERHFVATARYIARNPVRAHLVESAAHWRWSSHAATAGLVDAPSFLETRALLEHFGPRLPGARAAYAAYVAVPDSNLVPTQHAQPRAETSSTRPTPPGRSVIQSVR